jgi:hypothetical protein
VVAGDQALAMIELSNEQMQDSVRVLVVRLLEVRGPKTKQELADLLDIAQDALSHTLRADPQKRRRNWTLRDVMVLSEYYDVAVEVLTGVDAGRRDALVDVLVEEERERDGL